MTALNSGYIVLLDNLVKKCLFGSVALVHPQSLFLAELGNMMAPLMRAILAQLDRRILGA